MFTDGRYVYLIAEWAEETSGSAQAEGEDEDDVDENAKNEKKAARYGVDIYDPQHNFDYVRGVELHLDP